MDYIISNNIIRIRESKIMGTTDHVACMSKIKMYTKFWYENLISFRRKTCI
jgi:hypothetical protein